ncbi:MAG: hypothetical protein L6R42_008505, partial [Xanthoria sp. 1 TBL-2021]
YVESEQWLGSLIHANETLVEALMAFEVLDKDLEDDSDSDAECEVNEWDSDEAETAKKNKGKGMQQGFAGLSLGQKLSGPPFVMVNGKDKRDDSESEQDEDDEEDESGDEDNPFGDINAVSTPKEERPGMVGQQVLEYHQAINDP